MWGYSEIEASIISNSYNVIKGSINVCTAFAQTQLDKLLEKVWANINWLYYNTDGGMAHLSQAKIVSIYVVLLIMKLEMDKNRSRLGFLDTRNYY